MTQSLSCKQRPRWRIQKESLACARIDGGPLCTSLLGDERARRVQQHLPRNQHGAASCARKLDQRTDRLVPAGFPCQQPQKQDDAHAAFLQSNMNELSCSAVKQGKELLRHPVVEQHAMNGTRLTIREQDHQKSTNNLRWHDSRAVSEELLRQTP